MAEDCRALKIISNDTKLEQIFWVSKIENPLFKVCVGAWVGGQNHPRKTLLLSLIPGFNLVINTLNVSVM